MLIKNISQQAIYFLQKIFSVCNLVVINVISRRKRWAKNAEILSWDSASADILYHMTKKERGKKT